MTNHLRKLKIGLICTLFLIFNLHTKLIIPAAGSPDNPGLLTDQFDFLAETQNTVSGTLSIPMQGYIVPLIIPESIEPEPQKPSALNPPVKLGKVVKTGDRSNHTTWMAIWGLSALLLLFSLLLRREKANKTQES